jgi:hypothetical protein
MQEVSIVLFKVICYKKGCVLVFQDGQSLTFGKIVADNFSFAMDIEPATEEDIKKSCVDMMGGEMAWVIKKDLIMIEPLSYIGEACDYFSCGLEYEVSNSSVEKIFGNYATDICEFIRGELVDEFKISDLVIFNIPTIWTYTEFEPQVAEEIDQNATWDLVGRLDMSNLPIKE